MRRGTLTAIVCLWLAANATFVCAQEHDPRPLLYQVLDAPVNASSEQLNDTFVKAIRVPDLDALTRTRLVTAYSTLANPKMREAYDAGKAAKIDVDFALENTEAYGKMIATLDPPARPVIEKLATKGGNLLMEAVMFTAFNTAQACAEAMAKSDSGICDQALASLGTVSGLGSMPTFMLAQGGAKAIGEAVLKRFLSNPAMRDLVADNLSLAVATFANGLFWQIWNNPHWAEFDEADRITDPLLRAKKKAEIRKKLIESTTNSDATSKLLEEATNVVGASGLSFLTTLALRAAKQRFRNTCVEEALEEELEPKKGWARVRDHLKTSAVNFPQFMAWMYGVSKVTRPAFHALHESHSAAANLKRINAIGESASLSDLHVTLERSEHDWDSFRHSLMARANEDSAWHIGRVTQFDTNFQNMSATYEWMANGMPPEGMAAVRRLFKANLSEADWNAQIGSYARAFFCGPPADQAITETRHVGVVPTNNYAEGFQTKFTPFRVFPERDPQCADPDDPQHNAQFTARISGSEQYKAPSQHAGFAFFRSALKPRQDEIDFYESRVSDELKTALNGDPKSDRIPPEGILPSFLVELKALFNLEARLKDPQKIAAVKEKIGALSFKAQAASELLGYLSMPIDKRVAPELTVLQFVDQIGQTTGQESDDAWKEEVAGYEKFMKRDSARDRSSDLHETRAPAGDQ